MDIWWDIIQKKSKSRRKKEENGLRKRLVGMVSPKEKEMLAIIRFAHDIRSGLPLMLRGVSSMPKGGC